MSFDPVSSNSHHNLDEQIAQLMQCKPLSEQEVSFLEISLFWFWIVLDLFYFVLCFSRMLMNLFWYFLKVFWSVNFAFLVLRNACIRMEIVEVVRFNPFSLFLVKSDLLITWNDLQVRVLFCCFWWFLSLRLM